MSKDREAKLEVRIRNEKQNAKRLRLGLAWPREIKPEREEMETLLPAKANGRGWRGRACRSSVANTN